MRKLVLCLWLIAVAPFASTSATAHKTIARHVVRTYTKKDGTVVHRHMAGHGSKAIVGSGDYDDPGDGPAPKPEPDWDNSEVWKAIVDGAGKDEAEEKQRRTEDAEPLPPRYFSKFGKASGARKVPYFTRNERNYIDAWMDWSDTMFNFRGSMNEDKANALFDTIDSMETDRMAVTIPALFAKSDKDLGSVFDQFLKVRDALRAGDQDAITREMTAANARYNVNTRLTWSIIKGVYDDPKRQRNVTAKFQGGYIVVPG